MNKSEKMNILLCFDDKDWNYTRHAAVTILSLLETNKKNKIKIYIMTSCLSQENIDELKRIVNLYNQEIEFIISDDIVPEDLKKVIINRREWIRWPRYRWFFPLFIKGIDRLLYLDCDVLVVDDISDIYNMDMHWKAIVWYLDCFPYRCKNKLFWTKNYINSWVLLFDVKKYDVEKINVKKMKEINEKYSKYFHWWDQDKANIIFKDDIFVYKQEMNYQIIGKCFNKWLSNAKIIHCLEKPYIEHTKLPLKFVKLYYYYLNLTKWKWYHKQKSNLWFFWNLYSHAYSFYYNLLILMLWDKQMERLTLFRRKLENYKSITNK